MFGVVCDVYVDATRVDGGAIYIFYVIELTGLHIGVFYGRVAVRLVVIIGGCQLVGKGIGYSEVGFLALLDRHIAVTAAEATAQMEQNKGKKGALRR